MAAKTAMVAAPAFAAEESAIAAEESIFAAEAAVSDLAAEEAAVAAEAAVPAIAAEESAIAAEAAAPAFAAEEAATGAEAAVPAIAAEVSAIAAEHRGPILSFILVLAPRYQAIRECRVAGDSADLGAQLWQTGGSGSVMVDPLAREPAQTDKDRTAGGVNPMPGTGRYPTHRLLSRTVPESRSYQKAPVPLWNVLSVIASTVVLG
jgi:hypothetical protein